MPATTGHQVVYHLGAHKTGSSLLQKYLRDNPQVLDDHGLIYLSRSEMNECVGWGKRLIHQPEILAERIAALLAGHHEATLVTSHENTLGPPLKPDGAHLYPRGPEIVAHLAGVLDRWPSRVLLYLRPQDEFLESYYLQRIHQGGHLTFAAWLEQVDLEALSWRPVVDALTEHFGPEGVDVVDFGLIRAGQDAFLADFLRRIDPTLEITPSYAPIRNPSISGKGLRIALAANKHLRSDVERKAMRVFLQRYFSNRTFARPVLLSEEQKAQLQARYGEEYRALTSARPATGSPGGER
jgi:hypothetical protein